MGVVVIYRFGEGVGVGERVWFVVCDDCGLLSGLGGVCIRLVCFAEVGADMLEEMAVGVGSERAG